jgi:hypothetical protein
MPAIQMTHTDDSIQIHIQMPSIQTIVASASDRLAKLGIRVPVHFEKPQVQVAVAVAVAVAGLLQ